VSGNLAQPFITPELKASLIKAIKESDKEFLNRFPLLSPGALSAASIAYAAKQGVLPEPSRKAEMTLRLSGTPAAPAKDEFLKPIGYSLLYGDESALPGGTAYGDNLELAEAFNLLADNAPGGKLSEVKLAGERFTSLGELLRALRRDGTSVTVLDRRYYANFGDLRLETNGVRRDVRTPLFVDTGLTRPGGRRLILPVTHSELTITLRGRVNADLIFFFGVGGDIAFFADCTANQKWVGGRTAARYSGDKAVELLERAAWVRRELKAKVKAFKLPMGGYGLLGNCNDASALVTGRPAYPMLRRPEYFSGSGALDAAARALPNDLKSSPSKAVLLDSSPFDEISDIPFAEVREGLQGL
jgi:hypothetical protein